MRILKSLLSLIQFSAFCIIFFGISLVDYPYQSGESAALFRLQDEELRGVIQNWHQSTIALARVFTIGSGVVIFALSTGAVVLLNRQKQPFNIDDR